MELVRRGNFSFTAFTMRVPMQRHDARRFLLTPVAAAAACGTSTALSSKKATSSSWCNFKPASCSTRCHFPKLLESCTGLPFVFLLNPLGVTRCYSTCSHYEAENEGVVNAVRFLSLTPFSCALVL